MIRTAARLFAVAALAAIAAPASAQNFALNRRYDQYTYLTSHNAFAAYREGYINANQEMSIEQQLNYGVRCFMFDVYLVRQKDFLPGAGYWWKIKIYGSEAAADAETSSTWRNETPYYIVAHGATVDGTDYGYGLITGGHFNPHKSLQRHLYTLWKWQQSHPNEIITIILENYANAPKYLHKALYYSGVGQSMMDPNGSIHPTWPHWNVAVQGWPRVNFMRDNRMRFVVFDDRGGMGARSHANLLPYQWRYMVGTKYGNDACFHDGYLDARGESNDLTDLRYPLMQWNHFPDAGAGVAQFESLNAYNETLKARLNKLIGGTQRIPNFLAVDHVNHGWTGGARAAVARCDQLWQEATTYQPNLSISFNPPTGKNSWHTGDASLFAERFGGILRPEKIHVTRSVDGQGSDGEIVPYQYPMSFPLEGEGEHWISVAPQAAVRTASGYDLVLRGRTLGFRYQRDVSLPTITATLPPGGLNIGGRLWYRSAPLLTVSTQDAVSGVAAVTARIGSGPLFPLGTPKAILILDNMGYIKVALEVEDRAGLKAQRTVLAGLDALNPRTVVAIDGAARRATFTAADNLGGVGVARTEYRIDAGAWTTVTPGIAAELPPGPCRLEYRSADRLGNVEPIKAADVA